MPDSHCPKLPHKSYAHILTGEVQGKCAGHSEMKGELPSMTDVVTRGHGAWAASVFYCDGTLCGRKDLNP